MSIHYVVAAIERLFSILTPGVPDGGNDTTEAVTAYIVDFLLLLLLLLLLLFVKM